MRKIIVSQAVFELVPAFYRGLVIVEELTNHAHLAAVATLLQQCIEQQVASDFTQDARVMSWDTVHRKFGSNPNKFPPSIKALLKRIKSNAQLPYINSVVALFNYISLKYRLPCGGDDLDPIQGDLLLGISDGTESFMALGAEKAEAPVAGEVIYVDTVSRTVMCRRWNWRNSSQTKIGTGTCRMVINIDCLPPIDRATGKQARDELATLLVAHCGARLQVGELYAGAPEMAIDL